MVKATPALFEMDDIAAGVGWRRVAQPVVEASEDSVTGVAGVALWGERRQQVAPDAEERHTSCGIHQVPKAHSTTDRPTRKERIALALKMAGLGRPTPPRQADAAAGSRCGAMAGKARRAGSRRVATRSGARREARPAAQGSTGASSMIETLALLFGTVTSTSGSARRATSST